MRRRAVGIGVVAAAVLVAGSCSLPEDERSTPIDADELGDLADPTTTTSVPTSALPPVTSPSGSGPSLPPPSVAIIPTDLVRVFYTIGSSDSMQFVPIPLTTPVGFVRVRQELEEPRTEVVQDQGLRSSVRPGLIAAFEAEGTTLSVSLDQTVLNAMSEIQLRRAIAQIVLTFTAGFAPPDAGAISSVLFLVGGAPIPVVLPSTDALSALGVPVTYADFQSLLGTGPPSTQPPTSPPSTSAPPASTDPATTVPTSTAP